MKHTSNAGPWVRPLILGMSCLVLGFVGGWVLKGGGGSRNNLPKLGKGYLDAVTTPSPSKTVTDPAQAGTQTEAVLAAPDRSQVPVAVLNGTPANGLAATKATQLRGLGYTTVSTGNAPTSTEPSVVYFRPTRKTSAEQTARDLGITSTLPLPASGAISLKAGEFTSAHVIVVLHSP